MPISWFLQLQWNDNSFHPHDRICFFSRSLHSSVRMSIITRLSFFELFFFKFRVLPRCLSSPQTFPISLLRISRMPWLSRRNSSEEPMNSSFSKSPAMMTDAPVMFIPGMMDASCGTSPTHHRNPPMRMMLDDMKVMLQNMQCLPEMAMSMWSMEFGSSMIMSWMDIRDICLQMMLLMVEMCGMMLCLPMMMCLPGMVCLPMYVLFAGIIALFAMPLNQDQVVQTPMPPGRNMDDFMDERWIYMNGSMTR